jgi:hypothetical protein
VPPSTLRVTAAPLAVRTRPSVAASGSAGSMVARSTPSSLAAAASTAALVNDTSSACGVWLVRRRDVDRMSAGSWGHVTRTSAVSTGASASSAPAPIAIAPRSPAIGADRGLRDELRGEAGESDAGRAVEDGTVTRGYRKGSRRSRTVA